MNEHDMLGYLASSLVLTTFWIRSMFDLRLIAIAGNFAFIAYGHGRGSFRCSCCT